MTDGRAEHAGRGAWPVVAGQELRDLWLGGRGFVLLFASASWSA